MANRAYRTLLFTALAAFPASAGHAEERDAPALEVASFERSFVAYESLPPQPAPAAHAVDLDTIEPPVEAQPATTAIKGGNASYYGRQFHGRRTASGEAFDMNAMTAAHRTLPFGTLVQVTNPRNGKTVTVRINDRGPFHGNRVIDVSRAAATELGLIGPGKAHVELAVVG